MDIGFNANYLLEVLRYMPGEDEADVQGTGAGSHPGAGFA
jgi:hypothetical protein